jgi:hypothetical protein
MEEKKLHIVDIFLLITVKPVLGGHLWNKEKVAL